MAFYYIYVYSLRLYIVQQHEVHMILQYGSIWLEHLWNHENMFETRMVRVDECYSLRQVRRHNRDIFSIFLNMEVYHFLYQKENQPRISQICIYGIFFKGLKNEFETTVVNELFVLGPLKVY